MSRWFRGGEALDRETADRFGPAVEEALDGGLAGWEPGVRDRLALIVLLDQFARSIHRDSPHAFAGAARAERLALEGLGAGMDAALAPEERLFFVMPLLHAEDYALLERVGREMRRIVASAPEVLRPFFAMGVEQADKYRAVVARFGRFPHRNQALGRPSTTEELVFLERWSDRRPPSTFEALVPAGSG